MNPVQKTAGAALAAVAATLFFTSGASILATVPTSAGAVKCLGVNACKGQSLCATANSSCKGQNSCKGKGWIEMNSAEACNAAGGTVIEG